MRNPIPQTPRTSTRTPARARRDVIRVIGRMENALSRCLRHLDKAKSRVSARDLRSATRIADRVDLILQNWSGADNSPLLEQIFQAETEERYENLWLMLIASERKRRAL